MTRRMFRLLLAGAAFAAAAGAARAEEVVLNAVHFTPAQVAYAQSFLRFVDKVNARGKGVVQILVRGGPEVIPPLQLGEAQKSGLIDMINCPAGLYLNMVPEGEAFSASYKTPWEIRENGGWALISGIYEKKGNAKLLAHVDAGAGFHIFTVPEPAKTADGGIDWSKLTIRSAPLYREFLEKLGATVVVQGPGDVYTSLERGLVNANGYTILGYAAFGWDKFTKHRVDPSFFQTDVLVSMNQAKWDALSPEAQKILEEVAVEFERESYDNTIAETKAQGAAMIAAGQTVTEMTGAGRDAYLAAAAKASWDRIAARDPANVDALKAKFLD